jgi:hypothetical protein
LQNRKATTLDIVHVPYNIKANACNPFLLFRNADCWNLGGTGSNPYPELKSVIEILNKTVMRSRANSTVMNYLRYFHCWKRWGSDKERCTFCFISATKSGSHSVVEEAVNVASWMNQLAHLLAKNE